LSSLKASPRGASQAASRALTCSACARDAHKTARSSAYAEDRIMPTGLLEGLPGERVVVLGAA
jgi:hypothetical protein